MSSFFGIFWYILFLLLLSWTKTSIKTAYTTFINSLETQADNTVEKDRKFTVKEQRRGKPHQPELYVRSVTISKQSFRKETKFNLSAHSPCMAGLSTASGWLCRVVPSALDPGSLSDLW